MEFDREDSIRVSGGGALAIATASLEEGYLMFRCLIVDMNLHSTLDGHCIAQIYMILVEESMAATRVGEMAGGGAIIENKALENERAPRSY